MTELERYHYNCLVCDLLEFRDRIQGIRVKGTWSVEEVLDLVETQLNESLGWRLQVGDVHEHVKLIPEEEYLQ